MRLFVGIKLGVKLVEEIVKMQESLKKEGFLGNYTDKMLFHITLVFIGEVEQSKLKKLINALNEIEFLPYKIEINKIKRLKNMIVLEAKETNELSILQSKISTRIKELGFIIDDRKYYPHITILRENYESLNYSNKDISLNDNVTDFILYESVRINGKLIYKPIYIKKAKNE